MNKRGAVLSALFFVMTCGVGLCEEPIPSPSVSPGLIAPVITPRISAYLNGSKDVGVFKGWPMVIKVTIEHPDVSAAQPLTIISDLGDWTKNLSVDVRTPVGTIVNWPFEGTKVSKKSDTLTLDAKRAGFLVFLLSPEESSKLDVGSYELRIRLTGKTETVSGPVSVKVIEHPETLPARGEVARDRLRALYFAFKGEKDKAKETARSIPYHKLPSPGEAAAAPEPVYATVGPAGYVPAEYQASTSGGQELLSLAAAFGFNALSSHIDGSESMEGFPVEVPTAEIEVPAASSSAAHSSDSDSAALNEILARTPILPGSSGASAAHSSDNNSATLNEILARTPILPGSSGTSNPAQNPSIIGQAPTRRAAPDGFNGPDMAFTLSWTGPVDLDLWIENQDGIRRPVEPNSVQAGTETFRPWDIHQPRSDAFYYVVAFLNQETGSTPATVTIEVPGRAPQSLSTTLDTAKDQAFWIAFKVDGPSGDAQPIGDFYHSTTDYENGEPPIRPAVEETDGSRGPQSEGSSEQETQGGEE